MNTSTNIDLERVAVRAGEELEDVSAPENTPGGGPARRRPNAGSTYGADEHPDRLSVLGATVWLTGLPSAGKTTLARALADRLRTTGRPVEVLDGDELRRHLTADLGFSRADRDRNVERIAYVARLLAGHGVLVLVSVIAPYAATRAAVRTLHQETGTAYVEVHVSTPLEVCERRDPKGLYARARAGVLTGLTGVDDPYEPPPKPDLRLDTAGRSVEESVAALHDLLAERGLV